VHLAEVSMLHAIAGVAGIMGVPARMRMIERLDYFDNKYVKPFLCKQHKAQPKIESPQSLPEQYPVL